MIFIELDLIIKETYKNIIYYLFISIDNKCCLLIYINFLYNIATTSETIYIFIEKR